MICSSDDIGIRQKRLKCGVCLLLFFILLPLFADASEWSVPSRAISLAVPSLPGDSSQVNKLINAFSEIVGDDLVAAESYADKALTLSEEINYTKGVIRSSRAKGDVFRIRGEFALSEEFLRRAILLSEQEEDEIELAFCHLSMYRLFFVQGNYQKAATFNAAPLRIGEKSGNQRIRAEAYGNEGISSGMKGNHIQAVEFFLQSLEGFRALDDDLQVGVTLMRIGHTFELAGSYEKALDYLFQALEVNKRVDHLSNTGWNLLNIGVTYSRLYPDSFELKRDYYTKALELAEKSGDFRLTLTCLDNIGGSYSLQGNFAKANHFLMKAYNLSKEAGHNSRTVFITGNLAENFLYMGKLDSALSFGSENLRIAAQENNAFEKRQAYAVLSQVYASRDDHKKAYEMLRQHTHISDSLFNVQKSQQIEDLREKYEAEKKEQEILALTQEKAAAEFRRNSFAMLAVLFLLIGALITAILRLRMKRNQLLLQKEMELDRLKSRFFANISHEFRTPLTLLLGPINDMIERSQNPADLRYLKPMRKNAGRVLELVNQLLELSKIESGKLKPVLLKQNVVSAIRGIAMSFDSLAEMKHITLDVFSSQEEIEICVDPDKLEKVLSNLLSNAFKFTPEGGRITVSIERQGDPTGKAGSGSLHVMVKDSGSGIPPHEINHIFDRFYQADNNQLHQQDGSGIGLALTRELVELHRGTIWAESSAHGTEMHFRVPLNLNDLMPEFVVERSAAGSGLEVDSRFLVEVDFPESGESKPGMEKPLVLLIEDHPDVRNYTREILAGSFMIVEAADGELGISLALDKIPDLILCDVMMPKKNGHEVCAALKHDERTSHIPIILLTAKADIESRIEGLETKADDYLTKPFVPKELVLRIRNLIDSRRQLRDRYLRSMTLKPAEVAITSLDEKFLKKLMEVVERNIGDEKFGVEALGSAIGMSRSQLHRKLKALIGQGPNQFIRSFRLNRAHDMLKANGATSAEIAYSVGFSSPSYFTKCFHEQFGYTPSEIASQPNV